MLAGHTIFALNGYSYSIANLCHRYTCILKILQPRNFLTIIRKHVRTCAIHKNYCLAYLGIVAAHFSTIVYSACSCGNSIIAIFMLYSVTGFYSTVPYRFIHPWLKYLHGVGPQSGSTEVHVRKGT